MKQIRHVYCASGTHAIEVTDAADRITRGRVVPHNQPAFHAARLVAFTSHFGEENKGVWALRTCPNTSIRLSTDNNFAETVPLALAGERSEQGPEDVLEEEGK